ncbi:MAG: ORF6N domain-containing protein [Candidatus Omnitrophica bacterium]|nr:ORF6N domain-containing protein [Candidatus Omnitrophota bacterium]
MSDTISIEVIMSKIFAVRGRRIMLDKDLAQIYQVSTKALIQAVKRNIKRFPEDFMYLLTQEEVANLRSQFVTSSWGGRRYLPYAFTEQGVAMLSSVLNSDCAIMVNIQIMRAFTKLREILLTHKELIKKLEELEKRLDKHDVEIQAIFDCLRQLAMPPDEPKRAIGFHA